jgi:acetyltransferase-like isoleucine patch superfamily enzyme
MVTIFFRYIKIFFQLNIIKTLFFNFKVFPFKTAIKLPVFFYGSVKFASITGNISINSGDIKHGMIVFGSKDENIIATRDPVRLFITGKLVFNGTCRFSLASQIVVWDNGSLEIGDNAWFGTYTRIVAFNQIIIGDNLLASWECQIFDTDFHFIKDVRKDLIYNNCNPVHIGNNNWIGNRTTILKGTTLPNFCIVASNSLCNKDYTGTCPEYSAIGGIPAQLLKEGITFINHKPTEKKLNHYFWKNRGADSAEATLF